MSVKLTISLCARLAGYSSATTKSALYLLWDCQFEYGDVYRLFAYDVLHTYQLGSLSSMLKKTIRV